jgi:hypothetical protein
MRVRAVGQVVWASIVFSPFSCSSPPGSYGFGTDNTSSDDGGGQSNAATASPAPTGTASSHAAPAASSAQNNSNEAGASQPTNPNGGSGRSDAGSARSDASTSPADASMANPPMADASTVDSSTMTGDAGTCVTPNLGCMLSPPASTGDIRQDCVNRINQFRTQCACLPALQRWTDGEMCADLQAQYDSQQMVGHAGFRAGCTAMFASCCSMGVFGQQPLANSQDECPGYPSNDYVISTCLQQMWNEGPPPQGESVQACIQDTAGCFQMHGHFINMSSTMSSKVACGFYTTSSGQVWATQNFAP